MLRVCTSCEVSALCFAEYGPTGSPWGALKWFKNKHGMGSATASELAAYAAQVLPAECPRMRTAMGAVRMWFDKAKQKYGRENNGHNVYPTNEVTDGTA